MELKELQSELEALRSLYGLLRCDGNFATNELGERSKLLLKELLDGATERVLQTHKKIIAAAEHGVGGTSRPSESENFKAKPDFQASVSPHGNTSSLQKAEHSPDNLTTTKVVSHQARLSFSLDKPETTTKRDRLARILSKDSKLQVQQCGPLGHFYQARGDGRKLLDKHEGMKLVKRNETVRQSSIHRFQGSPSVAGSVVVSSRSPASRVDLANQDEKKVEAESDCSKDVDKVVKHIESHISALRLCSKLADTTRGAVPHSLFDIPTLECSAKRSELCFGVEPSLHRNEMLSSIGQESQKTGNKDDSDWIQRLLGQSENEMLDDITNKSRRIQHKEVGQSCKHSVRRNDTMNKMGDNKNVNGMVEAGGDKQSETTGCYVNGLRIPIKQYDITKRPPLPMKMPCPIPMSNRRKELTPRIAKLRPSSIPTQSAGSKASVKLVSNKKSLAYQVQPEKKDGNIGILGNKTLLHQQESEDSSTAGTDSSDSVAYSPSQVSAASVSGSLSHGSSYDSRSLPSSDYRDASESSTSYSYPTRTRKAKLEPGKAERRLGRLRRLKNKLGLIFHHHHHHHHHHDKKGDQTKSMWSNLHKAFHPRTRIEAHDKSRKGGRVSNVPVKHQVGHFHALVQGLMQHLRHSKKSKPSKGGIHGHKNRTGKQFHCWQKFQRQGGVKLPNTKRVKIGFTSKKQQPKLPKLR